jgi:hypothetical protein
MTATTIPAAAPNTGRISLWARCSMSSGYDAGGSGLPVGARNAAL